MRMDMLLVYACVVWTVHAQDCKVGGKRCADHVQCCGGCCFNEECVDTYRSCLEPLDVCRDHVCVGEESCVVYTPPNCLGCEPLAMCQILEPDEPYQ